MRRALLPIALLAVLSVLLLPASPASAVPALPAGFQDTVAIPKIEQPTNIEFAPDGRVFVAQKPGKIFVFDSIEDTTAELFADLRTYVYDSGDRGLLGLALDPQFEAGRPYVYALYTYDHILGDPSPAPKWGTADTTGDPCPDKNGGDACLVSGRLVRLTAEGDHAAPSAAAPTQTQLLEGWCQQFSSHSIGDLRFGPEGALYVSGGDGASFSSADYGQFGNPVPNPCGDPPSPKGTALSPPSAEGGALRSQNLKVLNGKILRIDPDTGEGLPTNPLASSLDANTRRIVASGFRNPFRFEFDPVTDELYVANVGSSEIEEIDRLETPPATLFNSGWPCYEGPGKQFQYRTLGLKVCEDLYDQPGGTTPPLFYYSHGQSVVPGDECSLEFGSALSGVEFYEGEEFPEEYKGAFFFADSVRGCVWVMFAGSDGRPDPNTTQRFLREDQIYPAVDIEEGPDGLLYYTDLVGYEPSGGSIHRISYEPGAPTAKLSANPPYGAFAGDGSLDVTFNATGSSDPDDEALTFDWDLDGDGDFELQDAAATQVVKYTKVELEEKEDNDEPLNPEVAVKVTDGEGLSSVARVTVYPGDKPPTLVINKPSTSQLWSVGDTIELEASGTSASGVFIGEPLRYYWSTGIAHCPSACHVHPLQIFAGTRRSSFTAPEHDYPSHLEITATVSDSRGLTTSKTITLDPRTVDLSIVTSPPGIEVTAGLLQGPSPQSLTGIDGSQMLLSVPETAEIGGNTYTFKSWSDGGPRIRSVELDQSVTSYKATFTTPGEPEPEPETGGGTGGSQPPPIPAPSPPTVPSPPPVTALGKHPPTRTAATTAKFSFGANLAGATFSCKLDGKPKGPCRSPKTYKKLKPGRHTFKVWAILGVMTDPTPAKFSWKVLPPKR